jgi:PhzF family phenazine biosynthesis protein
VDVFTAVPLLGNPVAVVLDPEGLTTEQMQAFTDWTNLSEATFVGPPTHPDADYSVRIFTSGRELPFAGHPTLGTCHAWLAAGGAPKGEAVVQECGVGLVPIRLDPGTGALSFRAPERRRSGPLDEADVDLIARGLGIDREDIVDHQWCDNGPPWQAVMLRSAADVLDLQPGSALLDGLFVGVIGPHPSGAATQFEVRAFFPTVHGLAEDPVTGSLNAALGQWLIGSGLAGAGYTAAQGTRLGRAGRVRVERVDGGVWVGGHSVTVLEGTATI